MAKGFDIRHFFRRAPRDWLKRYFDDAKLLADFDWSAVPKRKIDALVERWLELDEATRRLLSEDFLSIKMLATPACKIQIIDEAAYFGEQDRVAAKLLALGDFYACAFWVRLEQPRLWEGALRYAIADAKSKTYWRKRVNMPKLARHPNEDDARALAAALTQLFTKTEARGGRCVVHLLRRGADGAREYFFAYPEDHRHTPLVYREGQLVAQPHNPAFEVIFVHNDTEQTLSIWYEGSKERIKDLQVAFAQSVLGRTIARDSPRDDRAYDLQPFLDPAFTFKPDPVLGIESVDLRKMRVRIVGAEGRTIQVDLDTEAPSHVLHQVMDAVLADVPASQRSVTMVGLRVTFDPQSNQSSRRSRSFQIAAPSSCNLKADEFSPLIERLLRDHGIVPTAPRSGSYESIA